MRGQGRARLCTARDDVHGTGRYAGLLPQMFGSVGPYLLVIVYAGLTVWSELLPDHFLRAMPGGADVDKPDQSQSKDWARIARRLKRTR